MISFLDRTATSLHASATPNSADRTARKELSSTYSVSVTWLARSTRAQQILVATVRQRNQRSRKLVAYLEQLSEEGTERGETLHSERYRLLQLRQAALNGRQALLPQRRFHAILQIKK